MEDNYQFDTIASALEDLKQGKMVIVVDDEDRENEGDFIMAAEAISPEAVNFMTREGRGLLCVSINKKEQKSLSFIQWLIKIPPAMELTLRFPLIIYPLIQPEYRFLIVLIPLKRWLIIKLLLRN